MHFLEFFFFFWIRREAAWSQMVSPCLQDCCTRHKSDIVENQVVDNVYHSHAGLTSVFQTSPTGNVYSSRLWSRRENSILGNTVTCFLCQHVCYGFLESAHSAPAGNCVLEGESLFHLLDWTVQELKMSFIIGIKRSLSTNELWMDMKY